MNPYDTSLPTAPSARVPLDDANPLDLIVPDAHDGEAGLFVLLAMQALPGPEARALRTHLAECGACAGRFRDIALVAEVFRMTPENIPSPTATEARFLEDLYRHARVRC